ncbi:MAG TPA: SDR family NAD(P)-dependent oxidoreductase [Burkholderiales bacterium]|nr:SDR family NAD(P)-dependent oxidoreductase [Burkholderiales bacterium]
MTRTAIVAGAGGDAGRSICLALRGLGFHVVAAGRDRARLDAELDGAAAELVQVDLASPDAVARAFQQREADALIYNAGRIDLAKLSETTPEAFEASWRTNAFGAFLAARAVAPAMLARRGGSMVFVGATASVRGGGRTHAFASGKHALRGLARALAAELGPGGIHVAHVIVDGKIWGARTRRRFPDAREADCLAPDDVAAAVCALIEQPRSAWTFELDLHTQPTRSA